MPRITLGTATLATLSELKTSVEIQDTKGNIVGYFIPKLNPTQRSPLEPQISDEEIQRRLNEPGPRYTTEEVIEMAKAKRRAAEEGR